MEQLADLHFETHAHMKSVIGQDMITDDNVAVTELVKNSLDAEASKVVVSFRAADSEGGHAEIRVLDDGSGMSREDIERKWLNLAFSSKRSDGDRFYAGSKGIGRFSSDRLGRDLLMYTRQRGADRIIKVVIDWESFENKSRWNAKLHEIRFKSFELSEDEFEEETGIEDFRHGTCLRIQRPKSIWGAGKLSRLKRDLQRFMLPSQVDVGSGARLFLELWGYDDQEGLDDLPGEVRNRAFEKLPFKTSYIESRIDGRGSRVKTRLHYRGELLVEIVEKNRFKRLKGAKIALFHLNQYHKAFFKHETGIKSDEYGSVFLYLNGFRISPYGDPRNDWLGVDARHVQGNRRHLSARDIIGRVELVDRAGEVFEVTSDREGVKRNEAFHQLTDISDGFFGHVFKILERFIVHGLSWDTAAEGHAEIDERLSLHSGGFDSFMTKFALEDESKESGLVKELFLILFRESSKKNVLSIKFGGRALEILKDQKRDDIEKFEEKLSQMASCHGAKILNFHPDEVCDAIKKSHDEIRHLKAKNTALAERNTTLAEKNTALEKENGTISKQLVAEEKRRLFAETHMYSDERKLLETLHLTTLWAMSIEYALRRLLKKFKRSPRIVGKDLLSKTDGAHVLSKKMIKLARIISKTNFGMMTDRARLDIFSYIEQYIGEINDLGPYLGDLDITFSNSADCRFEIHMSPVETSMLVDNIIINARKNSADRLDVIVSESSKNFALDFVDNGDGLTDEYDHDMLFEAGITTTGGSGLGLYHARKLARKLYARISIENNEDRGATVRLVWRK